MMRHMPLESTAPPARRRCIAPCAASRRPSTLRLSNISAPCFVVTSTWRSDNTAACAESSSTETPSALSVPSRVATNDAGLASSGLVDPALPAVHA